VEREILQFLVAGVTAGAIYSIIALGFTIIFNATEVANFAQGDFVTLAGMVAVTLNGAWMLPLPLTILVTVAVVALVGAVMERLTIAPVPRATPFTYVLITLGCSIVLKTAEMLIWGKDPMRLQPFTADRPIPFFGATVVPQTLWVLGVAVLVMILLYLFFTFTRIGQAMLATSENRHGAALVGINVRRIQSLAFTMGGAMGAIAGVLLTPITTTSYGMGLILGIKGFAACVLGGFGSSAGAVVGGLALGIIEAMSAGYISSGYRDLIAMVLLVALLALRPGGILATRALR
jgi:branched-chain amino acid transport system permease protein